jgi:hypothetical protein
MSEVSGTWVWRQVVSSLKGTNVCRAIVAPLQRANRLSLTHPRVSLAVLAAP